MGVTEIISAMREAAPAGSADLTRSRIATLTALTADLLAAKRDAVRECERFESIRDRALFHPEDPRSPGSQLPELWRAWLQGSTVLVVGGTGCIGSTLLAQIAQLGPRRLVSVSRGRTEGWPCLPQAEYLHADIANRADLTAVFGQIRPDVVFHVAAQRDPGLAERDVQRTVRTNVFGTRNVAEIAGEFGVRDVICATSGKALRPYSREVYTAAKRAAELILARIATESESRLTAVRFTHVVDNSIVYGRLIRWAKSGVIRLHDPATMFYAQSARESAQLMLCAGLSGKQGTLRTYAINDLGWPVSLLDLALGTLLRAGSPSPVYFSGHDQGYERTPFPGLYDPATAGDVSPLLSAFEAIHAERDRIPGIDVATATHDLGRLPAEQLMKLEHACQRGHDPAVVRSELDELSWLMLDATLAALPPAALARAALLTEPYEAGLDCDHRRMLAAIRQYAQVSEPSPA